MIRLEWLGLARSDGSLHHEGSDRSARVLSEWGVFAIAASGIMVQPLLRAASERLGAYRLSWKSHEARCVWYNACRGPKGEGLGRASRVDCPTGRRVASGTNPAQRARGHVIQNPHQFRNQGCNSLDTGSRNYENDDGNRQCCEILLKLEVSVCRQEHIKPRRRQGMQLSVLDYGPA